MTDGNMNRPLLPDFVMVGISKPDDSGVMLLASAKLTHAELQERTEEIHSWAMECVRSRSWASLTAEMKTYSIVYAPSYPEAFDLLFQQWSPMAEPTKAIARRSTPTISGPTNSEDTP